jgi:acyl-coenzyme A thioesterase PaaI-like protein
MIVSENMLKWGMRFYPPLFFQRIWVKKIHKGFSGIDVKINRSVFTTNLGKSIFGGTIFSATDPFYALLFNQQMLRKGFKITVWLKSAHIQYLKPGRTDLYFSLKINSSMVNEAEEMLNTDGKFIKAYPIEIFDKQGELCASVMNEVYIRNLNFTRKDIAETK